MCLVLPLRLRLSSRKKNSLLRPVASALMRDKICRCSQTADVSCLSRSVLSVFISGKIFGFSALLIHFISNLQPLLGFSIDVFQRRDFDPVGDAVLLGEPASVNEPFWNFRVLE